MVSGQVGDMSWVKYPGWVPSDRVVPVTVVATNYDTARAIWQYGYVLRNGASAQQDIINWDLSFNAPAIAANAPMGWRAARYSPNIVPDPGVGFAALLPDEYMGYKKPPSQYQIAPGDSLTSFSIESAYPPGYARSRVQGWAPIPQLPDSLAYEYYALPDDTLNTRRGWTLGPTRYTQVVTAGSPDGLNANGFLGFMNLALTGSVLRDPAPIALEFALSGETVFRETFRAVLNGVDVTDRFHPGATDGADIVAVFEVGSLPLVEGTNVLVTTVEGIVPGTSQRGVDTDVITFTVDPDAA